MEYDKILSDAGLNNWESRVYVALLHLGSTTTGPLVKKCGVPQSKIYVVLDSLKAKGFANYVIKGKTKYFQASDPQMLLSAIKDKQREIEEAVPKMRQIMTFSENRQAVEVYEGMKSIRSLFVNLIETSKEGDEWLGFSIAEENQFEEVIEFWNKIGTLRYYKKLGVKLMDNVKSMQIYTGIYKDRWKDIRKFVRFSKIIFPATTVLFARQIIILDFISESKTAVVISSDGLFEHYRKFYLQEWERAKPV